MTINKKVLLCSALFSALALSGCGGGGGGSDASPAGATAEGVYAGTLTGSASSDFQLLVLENGEVWSMYGTQNPTIFAVDGFIQGSGSSSNGSFTSSNAKDFGYIPSRAAPINATFNATAKTITGTVTASTPPNVTFNGAAISGTSYDYNASASLTTVSGTWTTTSLQGDTVTLNVASNGGFTASSIRGCNFNGTIAPRASGKNVFNVSLTFGAAPCPLAGQTATGIALAYPLSSGRTQLMVSVVDSTRTNGTAVFGTR